MSSSPKVDLSEKTVKQLREIAKRKNISGYSTLRKDELVKCIAKRKGGQCKANKGCAKVAETKTRKVKGVTKYYVRCEGKTRSRSVSKAVYDRVNKSPKLPPSDEPIEPFQRGLEVKTTNQPSRLVLEFRKRQAK